MRSSTRPIVERLQAISIKDIASLIPRHNPTITCNPDAYGWRYPGKVILSMNGIKITDAAIVPQYFRFTWVRTAGKPRPLIVCQCRRKAQILYFYSGRYACKHCHRAQYVSERQSKAGRKLWKAASERQMSYAILLNDIKYLSLLISNGKNTGRKEKEKQIGRRAEIFLFFLLPENLLKAPTGSGAYRTPRPGAGPGGVDYSLPS